MIRIFTFYKVQPEAFHRLLPRGFYKAGRSVKIFVNRSGEADLAIVIGFAPLGAWVKCHPEKVHKAVNEPWHQGLFARYIRRHAKYFASIFTPHAQFDADSRIQRWPGNLEWHLKGDFDSLAELAPIRKTKQVSTVMSTKSHLPGHRERLEFISHAEMGISDLDRFGRGTEREIEAKEEGLEEYRYSFAIENSQQVDYFTEKLFDCLLTWTIPIYSGAPNIDSIFPSEAILQIDIKDTHGSLEKVKNALADPNDYRNRLPALKQAREKLLTELGFHGFLKHLLSDDEWDAGTGKKLKRTIRLTSLDSLIHSVRDGAFASINRLRLRK